MSAGHSFQIQ